MTARKIDIDPDLWAQVRIRALTEKTTATALVNEALTELLKRRAADPPKSSDGAPRSARPPRSTVTEGDFTLEHDSGGQQIITPAGDKDPWADLPKPKMIGTPEEAKAATASLPAIRPVPKPTSSRTRSKRPSRSGTAGTEG